MKRMVLLAVLALMGGLLFASGKEEATSAAAGGKQKLVIIAGTFAQNNMTGTGAGTGRNLLEEMSAKANITLEFINTPNTQEQQQTLFRVGSLAQTEEDLIYVLHSFADNRVVDLLEPLDKYIKQKPLDGYPDDYSKGMLNVYAKKGSLYALPIRAGVWNIWYNKKLLNERGISEPPRTPDELYEFAKKSTYVKPTGEKVFGFVSRGTRWDLHEQLAIGSRMFGGDVITPDYKIVINQAPVIRFLQLYRKMYTEGIMPPNWNALTGNDSDQLVKEGRAVITMASANYGPRYNDPKASKEAGNIFPIHMPLAKELWSGDKTYSDSISFTWAIAILKGSTQKETAWEAIRYLTTKDSSVEMAKNENAPARISVLRWQAETDPGAKVAADTFKYTRAALPPLENGNQIIDVIGEHVENVVIHGKPAQAEMDTAAKRIADLMK